MSMNSETDFDISKSQMLALLIVFPIPTLKKGNTCTQLLNKIVIHEFGHIESCISIAGD